MKLGPPEPQRHTCGDPHRHGAIADLGVWVRLGFEVRVTGYERGRTLV
jgi:hypothetical protein